MSNRVLEDAAPVDPTSSMVPPPPFGSLLVLVAFATADDDDEEEEEDDDDDGGVLAAGGFDGGTVVCAITVVEDVAAELALLDGLELLAELEDEDAAELEEEAAPDEEVDAATEFDCCLLAALVLAAAVEANDDTAPSPPDVPTTFGHSVLVPCCEKNNPISVFGNALVPLQSVLSILVSASRKVMQPVEHPWPF